MVEKRFETVGLPGVDLPEAIYDKGEAGAEARAAHAYSLYVLQQTRLGLPIEPYEGRHKDAAEARAQFVVGKVQELESEHNSQQVPNNPLISMNFTKPK